MKTGKVKILGKGIIEDLELTLKGFYVHGHENKGKTEDRKGLGHMRERMKTHTVHERH